MSALAKLQAGDNLNTAQALEWLAGQGIHTTGDGLRRARNAGRLPYLKVAGRARILYKAADLAAAFIREVSICHSHSQGAPDLKAGISGVVLPEIVFSKALAQATGKQRKT